MTKTKPRMEELITLAIEYFNRIYFLLDTKPECRNECRNIAYNGANILSNEAMGPTPRPLKELIAEGCEQAWVRAAGANNGKGEWILMLDALKSGGQFDDFLALPIHRPPPPIKD